MKLEPDQTRIKGLGLPDLGDFSQSPSVCCSPREGDLSLGRASWPAEKAAEGLAIWYPCYKTTQDAQDKAVLGIFNL